MNSSTENEHVMSRSISPLTLDPPSPKRLLTPPPATSYSGDSQSEKQITISYIEPDRARQPKQDREGEIGESPRPRSATLQSRNTARGYSFLTGPVNYRRLFPLTFTTALGPNEESGELAEQPQIYAHTTQSYRYSLPPNFHLVEEPRTPASQADIGVSTVPSPEEVSGLQQQQPRDRFAQSGSDCSRSPTEFLDPPKTQPTAPIRLERAAASDRRRWSNENSDVYSATTIDAAAPTENGRRASLPPPAGSSIIANTAPPATTTNGNSPESHAGEAPPSTSSTLTALQENIASSVDPSPQTQLTDELPPDSRAPTTDNGLETTNPAAALAPTRRVATPPTQTHFAPDVSDAEIEPHVRSWRTSSSYRTSQTSYRTGGEASLTNESPTPQNMAENNMDAAREGRLGEDGETWQRIAMRHLAAGDKAAQLFFSNAVFWAGMSMLSAFGP
ncbi:hypothetical protein DL770_003904 [Monosporascus sp. CRB-9-2]|nr:hypothetical protein DL770_003904 [Monosporascus sp. CRB-9-2]